MLKIKFIIVVISFFFIGGCAGVSHNRYQTADTLGKGNMKMMAGACYQYQVTNHPVDETEKMHREKAADLGMNTTKKTHLGNALAGVLPANIEVLFAYGVKENLDLEIRLSPTSLRGNTKIKIADFGNNGSFAIAPGIGFSSGSESSESHSMGDFESDKINQYQFVAELPLIIGWEFEVASPYVYLMNYHHFMHVRHRKTLIIEYEVENGDPTYSDDFDPDPTPESYAKKRYADTIRGNFSYNSLGLGFGVQFQAKRFILTPEVGAYWLKGRNVNKMLPAPGLALGGRW